MTIDASFVYGGLEFEIISSDPLVPSVAEPPSTTHHARVRVHVTLDEVERPMGPIRWSATGAEVALTATGLIGTIRRIGDADFEAHFHVNHTLEHLAKGVVETLATTIGELRGGVVFHTAAIVHRRRAVLFLGPSGAGKSTAGRLVEGAEELAEDRALVMPSTRGYDVFPLRNGTPSGIPRARVDAYPLDALLRVRRDGERSGIVSIPRASGIGVLRAAATSGGTDAHEPDLLARLETLTEKVLVANVYTRLDRALELPDFA